MSLINPSLLYALPLALVPVVLHFLLRSKPKRMVFPALRLIQSMKKSSTRRMRLKQFWLMLLRVIVIAFFILLLARPALPAANYGPNTYELLMTVGLIVAAFAACWMMKKKWENDRLPKHVIAYRSTIMKSGAGICAAILFLLLVIWPYANRLQADLTNPRPISIENIPVSAVFLFDSSLSMEYRAESKTRHDLAQEIASTHLDSLPSGSRIAVADNQSQTPILFQIDKTTARERIFEIEFSPQTIPLNTRLWDALSFQEQDRERLAAEQVGATGEVEDRYVREVYLFTDLARSAWDLNEQDYLRAELERLKYVQVYLIDVGANEPKNISLSNIVLNREEVLENRPVTMSVSVQCERQSGLTRQVELYIKDAQGKLVRRASEEVSLQPGTAIDVPLSFTADTFATTSKTKTADIIQGEVRISSTDAMPFDNKRFFTLKRRLPPKVLIVSDPVSKKNQTNPGEVWQDMLAPPVMRKNNKAAFQCELVRPEALLRIQPSQLNRYDNICLISVKNPRAEIWENLQQYVAQGGGLTIVVGDSKIDQVAYQTEAAASLLPANLKGYIRFSPAETIDFASGEHHPMLKSFEAFGGFGDLPNAPVNWCWSVSPNSGANVITNYTFSQPRPALIERTVGRGRVVMLTTASHFGKWSSLARSWWFLILAEKMMHYSAGGSQERLNYLADEGVLLPIKTENQDADFLLRLPNQKQLPLSREKENEMLLIQEKETLGQYQVLNAGPPVKPTHRFSLNARNEESDLTKITTDELDSLLGEERYQIAQSTIELSRQVGLGRIGQEMFPFVLAILFAFFWGEHFIANRFYEQEQQVEPQPRKQV